MEKCDKCKRRIEKLTIVEHKGKELMLCKDCYDLIYKESSSMCREKITNKGLLHIGRPRRIRAGY